MKRFTFLNLLGVALLLTALFGPSVQQAAAGAGGPVFTVTLVNEGSDAHPGDGICATLSGHCTLRAAIQEANAEGGVHTINFNLPGSGVHVMSITSGALPIVWSQLILNGTSQPNCTVPCIVLSGAVVGGNNTGLAFHTNNSLIKGFIITSWGNSGITINGTGNQIESNDIGFWPGNPTLLPNVAGINLLGGTSNVIGGTSAGDKNIISGNTLGITIGGNGGATSGTLIEGNFIGTNPAGTSARGNIAEGIYLGEQDTNTTIGGTSTAARNVISGNHTAGIVVDGATNAKIWGNFIGTNAAGTGALGNGTMGILVNLHAAGNQIGGTGTGKGNRIAYNAAGGVILTNTAGVVHNSIRHNSIFSNTGLGIDLGYNGVTLNDPHDADTGPNMLQNFPVLTAATSSTRVIKGTLNSVASSSFSIEVFASSTCDPSHYGEGKTFLGSVSVTTNVVGNGSFNFTVPAAFAVGNAITATATNAVGNTSEFSACRAAT
jgi:hypothetical protein